MSNSHSSKAIILAGALAVTALHGCGEKHSAAAKTGSGGDGSITGNNTGNHTVHHSKLLTDLENIKEKLLKTWDDITKGLPAEWKAFIEKIRNEIKRIEDSAAVQDIEKVFAWVKKEIQKVEHAAEAVGHAVEHTAEAVGHEFKRAIDSGHALSTLAHDLIHAIWKKLTGKKDSDDNSSAE